MCREEKTEREMEDEFGVESRVYSERMYLVRQIQSQNNNNKIRELRERKMCELSETLLF